MTTSEATKGKPVLPNNGTKIPRQINEPAKKLDSFMEKRKMLKMGQQISKQLFANASEPMKDKINRPESKHGDQQQNVMTTTVKKQKMVATVQSSYNPIWRQGIFFPIQDYATLEFVVSVGQFSPSSHPIFLSNPDDRFGRYFRGYVDGQLKYSATGSGPNVELVMDASLLFLPLNSYHLKIEINWGGMNKGWELQDVKLDGSDISFNAYDDTDETVSTGFPYKIFTRYIHIKDYIPNIGQSVEITIYSPSYTGRYVYLYINNVQVGSQVAWSPWDNDVLRFPIGDPSKSYVNRVLKLEFKVYIPCSTCTEPWTLKDWNYENTLSWKTIKYSQTVSIHTDWTPSSTARNDFKNAAGEMGIALYRASKGRCW